MKKNEKVVFRLIDESENFDLDEFNREHNQKVYFWSSPSRSTRKESRTSDQKATEPTRSSDDFSSGDGGFSILF